MTAFEKRQAQGADVVWKLIQCAAIIGVIFFLRLYLKEL
jgi:hypothetical protein